MGLIDVLCPEREKERVRCGIQRCSPAALGLVAVSVLPAAAQQTPPPLAYVQPLPGRRCRVFRDRLRQAGVYTGRIDGIWGADSQAALERFQQAHQLQVTGQLNQATAATLGLDPNALLATPVTAPAPPAPPADHLLPASVRAVQARLRTLGFYGGAVDGVWGEGTQVAIENFQRGAGCSRTGSLGRQRSPRWAWRRTFWRIGSGGAAAAVVRRTFVEIASRITSGTATLLAMTGANAMYVSDSRILTTHTGSLPRPAELVQLYIAKGRGEPVDAQLAEAGPRRAGPRRAQAARGRHRHRQQRRAAARGVLPLRPLAHERIRRRLDA